jgi:hypothetical protein
MSTVDYRIRLAATSIANLMHEWPELTFEDVRGINRHIGFSHTTVGDSRIAARGVGTGGSKLRHADLRAAWELAREISSRDYS